MGPPLLWASLLHFPSLLQTTWKPPPSDDIERMWDPERSSSAELSDEAKAAEDAAATEGRSFCRRWRHVLMHSLNPVGGDAVDRGWAEFDALGVLREVGMGEA